MTFKEVKMLINGEEVEINEFVQSIIGNAIVGMVSSLQVDNKPETIEIKIVKNKV